MSLRVSVEDLVVSGVMVRGSGEDIALRHAALDHRIDTAQAGWQGSSAAALMERSQDWALATRGLLARMSDFVWALHTSADGFSEMEARHAQALAAPGLAGEAIARQVS